MTNQRLLGKPTQNAGAFGDGTNVRVGLWRKIAEDCVLLQGKSLVHGKKSQGYVRRYRYQRKKSQGYGKED